MAEEDLERGSAPETGRNPLVVLAGFALLGAAVTLLLFGGDLLRRFSAPEPVDRPELFVTVQPNIAPLARASGLVVGDEAPNFVLEDFDGVLFSLAEFRGRPVIVNFWATWCTPCVIEMPELQRVAEEYEEAGLVILALNQDEPLAVARAFFYDLNNFTFIPLMDQRHLVAAQYGAFYTLPTTVFIDAEGRVTAVHRGLVTREQIKRYLEQTLS